MNPPLVYLKMDSYLSEEENQTIAKLSLKYKVDGIIVGSTIPTDVKGDGGVGGKVTSKFALEALRKMYILTQGKVPLISSGGVSTG
jgi:dihydroorotate dehydrogenase